ncbi:MAG: hypothetical protein Q4D79_07420 [Propionibacteriaceae bacterium]|nr:hypothetical protein [Propionibacteriaceae bacterium]
MLKPLSGIAGLLVALSLCSCASGTSAGPDSPTPIPSSPGISDLVTPAPTTEPSYSVLDEAPEGIVEAIKADLDSRGATGSETQVLEVRKVLWNDGSLGCPQPGKQYTQAQVDGLQVLVKVGDSQYDYRFGNDLAAPMLCDTPGFGIPSSAKSTDI